MKRVIAFLLCSVMIVTLFAGCGVKEEAYTPTGNALGVEGTAPADPDKQDTKQDLTLTYFPNRSMNPLFSTDMTNRVLFSLMYQGLFSVDRKYQVQPVLCKNYRISQDMRTWTFYLENATFSDGSKISARDAVATLQRAKTSVYYGGRFTHITDISLLEDGGVEIKLDTAFENLPILLDIPLLKAEEVDAERPLGTGPYMLDETGLSPRLRRTQWWCSAPLAVTASAVNLIAASEEGSESEQNNKIRDDFMFNGLDLVCADPSSDNYSDLRCDYELWSSENGNFLYLACSINSNVLKGELRAALTYAIDRELLAGDEAYYRGVAQAATLPASPQFPYYSKALAKRYAYDPERFARAVSDAGMTDAYVVLLVNGDDSRRVRVAEAIARMLEDGGLDVSVRVKKGQSYQNAVRNREYDLYLGQTRLSPNMDLSAFFSTWGDLSYGGVNNAGAYALCLESLANYGNYYTLHSNVMENGLICPILFQSYAIFTTRGEISALNPTRDNIFYYSTGKTMEDALIRE